MFRELRTASLLSKILHKDPTALPAWDALRMGTIGKALRNELRMKAVLVVWD